MNSTITYKLISDTSTKSDSMSLYYNTSTGANGYYSVFHNVDEWITDEVPWFKPKIHLTDFDKTKHALKIEERIESWLLENYDRYELIECGNYICDVIQEKAYELVSDHIDALIEEMEIIDENSNPIASETIIEAIINEIDFCVLYDVADEIINAPITMEEKLAEIGMSYRDFL